jgi:hypothetical protein
MLFLLSSFTAKGLDFLMHQPQYMLDRVMSTKWTVIAGAQDMLRQ